MQDPIVLGTAALGVAFIAAAVYQVLRSDRLTHFGRFEGKVVATWDADGRNMTLVENFEFIDANQKRWSAPKGSVVNGASIPQAFWSLIGGPFEGKYRNASVIHDVYCSTMSEPWHEVHLMFYHACRCGGVGERTAKVLYFAVHNYGPRWGGEYETRWDEGAPPDKTCLPHSINQRPPTDDEVRKMVAFIKRKNPSMQEIENLEIK